MASIQRQGWAFRIRASHWSIHGLKVHLTLEHRKKFIENCPVRSSGGNCADILHDSAWWCWGDTSDGPTARIVQASCNFEQHRALHWCLFSRPGSKVTNALPKRPSFSKPVTIKHQEINDKFDNVGGNWMNEFQLAQECYFMQMLQYVHHSNASTWRVLEHLGNAG